MNLIVVSNYSTLTAFGRVLKTSCIVLDRFVHGMHVVYSENEDGSKGRPYQPQQFPKGTWPILGVEATTDPLLAPYFIRTGAHQMVPTWEIDASGNYVKPTGETIDDWGYLLHWDAMYTTTDGCIRLDSSDDAVWLASEVLACIGATEAVQLSVV